MLVSSLSAGANVRVEEASGTKIPQLPEEVAAKVGKVEKVIDVLMHVKPELLPDLQIELEKLVEMAEWVLSVRRHNQEEQWWETIDARQRLADLHEWVKLSSAERAEWARATSLNSQVQEHYRMGHYTEALPLAQQVLVIREQVLGLAHPLTAASLNDVGLLHEAQGHHDQAISLHERALTIREQVLGTMHPSTATSLHNLAIVYWGQGQYAQAQPLYERALAITERAQGATHLEFAMTLDNLAVLYKDQGKYAQALPLYEQALAIREQALGAAHQETAISLNNLGLLYMAQGAYAKALPLYERALRIMEEAFVSAHPSVATSLNNLALLYEAQGAYAKALPLYERALRITEEVLGPDHPLTATVLTNLGILRSLFQPDAQAAQFLFRAVQSKWRYLTDSFPTLTASQQQQFLKKEGLAESGYVWHLLAKVPSLDRALGYQGTVLSKHLLAEAMRQENGAFQRVLAEAPAEWRILWRERESLRRDYATRSLQELPDSKSFLHDEPRLVAVSSTRELATRIEQLEQHLRREYPPYVQAARLQEVTVEQIIQKLRPGHALLEYVQFHPYDPQTKRLAETWHYGVYVLQGGPVPVVAVDLGDAAPIDAAIRQFQSGMQAAIERFKSVTPSRGQVRKSEATLAEASSALRKLVWQPLESHLTGVTRVYVAPDGLLSLLPFEVLAHQTKKGGWQYLAEERELLYLNTGRDLARVGLTTGAVSASPAARTAVLVGNPAFQATPREVARVVAGISPSGTMVAQSKQGISAPTLGAVTGSPRLELPRTWLPVEALDGLVTRAETQLKLAGWSVTRVWHEQAVEEAVLRLEAPRILQFATHGYLLDRPKTDASGWDNPLLRSMLLMTGVNHADPKQAVFYRVGKDLLSDTEARQRGLTPEAQQQARVEVGDGVLTAYEVTGMNLQGTELVNLTACETGQGEVTPEGVAGLRQAFLLAGARALTMSMWEVPAKETTQQISDFYQRWLGAEKGKKNKSPMTRYGAFRQTQQAALAKTRKQFEGAGHPFYWAGVIYLGDPGDLLAYPDQASSATSAAKIKKIEELNSPRGRETKRKNGLDE
ncbi:MAG: CHAT domain-containing protein [Nitrospirota bacterium]|nr:CHAT domain-containing protein [Nitrospirota bacterium]